MSDDESPVLPNDAEQNDGTNTEANGGANTEQPRPKSPYVGLTPPASDSEHKPRPRRSSQHSQSEKQQSAHKRSRSGHRSHSAMNRKRRAKTRHTGRWLVLAGAAVLLVVIAAGVWIAFTGMQARAALTNAAASITQAQSELLDGKTGQAATLVATAGADASVAASKTNDVVWRAVGAVPVLGATPKAVSMTANAADITLNQAMPSFVAAAEALDISTLKTADGRIQLERLPAVATALASAQGALDTADTTMADLPSTGVIPIVSDAAAQLISEINTAQAAATSAADILSVMPQLLGANGDQRYFVAFQSPVEVRGTGGFLGNYGLLTFSQGALVDNVTGDNSDLRNFPTPVMQMSPEYVEMYGENATDWVNMNMSPNFPYAGEQWAAAWRAQFNQSVNGVMAVDLSALQSVLKATGPITAPNGKVITADNVLSYLGNEIYIEFAGRDAARSALQSEVASALLERLLTLDGNTRALITAMAESVSGGHLQVWSSNPEVQQVLTRTRIAGQTPDVPGPYVQLVLNNGGANKLDYYTTREVSYVAGECLNSSRISTVSATLTNTVPADAQFPATLAGAGIPARGIPGNLTNRTLVYLHLPVGAEVLSIKRDGMQDLWSFGVERGHRVAYTTIDLAPGTPVNIEMQISEPISAKEPVVPVQPMVQPQQTTVQWSSCSGAVG